jgi:hypothetical protein
MCSRLALLWFSADACGKEIPVEDVYPPRDG